MLTDAVKEQVQEWQNRPLHSLYLIAYIYYIVVKVRHDGSVINKSIFLTLAINTKGHKKLLGMWMAENEGAKFWLSVLTELKNLGVQDILIACVDGLKDSPDAINSVYPQTQVQLCVIQMVRNSLKTLICYASINGQWTVRKVIYLAIESASKNGVCQFKTGNRQ